MSPVLSTLDPVGPRDLAREGRPVRAVLRVQLEDALPEEDHVPVATEDRRIHSGHATQIEKNICFTLSRQRRNALHVLYRQKDCLLHHLQ